MLFGIYIKYFSNLRGFGVVGVVGVVGVGVVVVVVVVGSCWYYFGISYCRESVLMLVYL